MKIKITKEDIKEMEEDIEEALKPFPGAKVKIIMPKELMENSK